MAVLTREQTGRRDYVCSRCFETIPAGDRYVSYAITPGGEMGYLGWVRGKTHLSPEACRVALAACIAGGGTDLDYR
jgi:hypothetical protein